MCVCVCERERERERESLGIARQTVTAAAGLLPKLRAASTQAARVRVSLVIAVVMMGVAACAEGL